ncbi:metallopeptidase TldD-related protein [Streptomyces sp. NPDC096095]|uniref:metallopeptidase TldD-related protein n=1 Tax=Streptomyces sp. NPDC096095 TaxID=3155545 RepID=UPI00331F67A0
MSEASDFLNATAAERGADCEVWENAHETDELVCRDGAVERRVATAATATALTVWKDGTEGYAVHIPGGADASLVDTALAVGRALGSAPPAPAHRTPPPAEPGPGPLADPRLDETVAQRLAKLTADPGDVDVELRARADRSRVLLHRAGGEPLRHTTGTFQLQARITAKGRRVGFIAHQMFGRSADAVLADAEGTELAELTALARVLARDPVPHLSHDDVLLDGRVMVKLFMLAVPAFQLDSVLEGRSPLAGRTGERIGSAGLSLVDDPLAADSPLPTPWDDEGTACRATTLLEDGVLRGFLSSRRTAAEAGTVSTGSGRRGASGEMPTVQPGFLALRPGTPLGDAPRDGRTLLKVVQANGAHTSNVITGDFSIGANAVLVTPDGAQHNAGNITLAGNVFELLTRIDGHDGRPRVNRGHTSFVTSPGVWTSGLTIGR